MTQYTKTADFTREQPMHPPKVPQKPKFYRIYSHYASLCMDLECKLFFFMNWKCNVQRFFNYHVTVVEAFIKPNIQYNAHGWLMH